MMNLDMKEATALCGVSRQTIYSWCDNGLLPYKQKRQFRLFAKEDLLKASEEMAMRKNGGRYRKKAIKK